MHGHTLTYLTLSCLLNIGTKENICILGRPTSFDCSSAAVGNNAQALLIHQGEREFLLEESSKEPSARLFTDLLTDWRTDCATLTVVSASCLTRLFFLQGLRHADTYSPLSVRGPELHFLAQYLLLYILLTILVMTLSVCRYQIQASAWVTDLSCASTAASRPHARDI